MFTKYYFFAIYVTHVRRITLLSWNDDEAMKVAKSQANKALAVICYNSHSLNG